MNVQSFGLAAAARRGRAGVTGGASDRDGPARARPGYLPVIFKFADWPPGAGVTVTPSPSPPGRRRPDFAVKVLVTVAVCQT